jgi:hypothetical protein
MSPARLDCAPLRATALCCTRAFGTMLRLGVPRSEVFVSDIDPADATLGGRRSLPEALTPDLVDTGTPPRKEREGLPPGYRMRADAHYVDQLTSRRGHSDARSGRDPDDLDSDARERRDGRERRTDRALTQLAEDLATIESAVGLLGEETSSLGRRVSLDLLKAHVFRASWLLEAQALVDNPQRATLRLRPLPALLGRVRDAFGPEFRLNGHRFDLDVLDWSGSIPVDETGITAGVTGAIVATLGLIGSGDGAAVRVTLSGGGDAPVIEIAQDVVNVRANTAQRFFDPAWTDRPGGWIAALGAAAARTAAHQHGGSAAFVLGDARGSLIRLTLGRHG